MSEPTSTANSRLIAVAGPIAEYIWRGEDHCLNEPSFWGEHCAMSETDWQMARTEPGEADRKFMEAVRRVHKQFSGPMWQDVCRAARELIIKSRSLPPAIAAEFEASRMANEHDPVVLNRIRRR